MYTTQQLDPELFEQLLFEANYPRLSHELRVNGTPYPPLDEQCLSGRPLMRKYR